MLSVYEATAGRMLMSILVFVAVDVLYSGLVDVAASAAAAAAELSFCSVFL